MHHFFVTPQQISGDKIRIEGGDVNHMKNVLRMKLHEKAEISDGESRTYLCEVEAYEEDVALLHILEEMEADTEPASKLYLFQGLPKSDKMELIVQKCTELGVDAIQPVRMTRCVPEPERNPEKNLTRLNRVAREAAKQCCRGAIPEVRAARPLRALEAALSAFDVLLVPWEDADTHGRRIADVIAPGFVGTAAVVIGPEGGMTAEEVEFLKECGGVTVTLGPRILRTETAGMAALTAVLTCSGDV